MKKILKSFLLLSLIAIGFSCTDPELDPLQFENISKGTIIALRGTALTNVYSKGIPVAEMFPRIATGSETFSYEAEILAEDPSTVASVDIYVIKKTGAVSSRVLLKNVPASEFKKDKYPNPSATISLTINQVLTGIGITPTYPLDAASVDALLSTYKFGIAMESDLNLADGTKVLAADIVAAGLFQSNQFYPAMLLSWAVTDYCTYDESTWSGDYDATENSEISGAYGPYGITLIKTGTNKFSTDNFYDSGWPLEFTLEPSTDVASQTISFVKQSITTTSGNVYSWEGDGTYNQCLNTMGINITVKKNGETSDQLVWVLEKNQ